jgi:hypothetical protein
MQGSHASLPTGARAVVACGTSFSLLLLHDLSDKVLKSCSNVAEMRGSSTPSHSPAHAPALPLPSRGAEHIRLHAVSEVVTCRCQENQRHEGP